MIFENFDAYFVYTCFSIIDIEEEIRSLQLDSADCGSVYCLNEILVLPFFFFFFFFF
jgi:hypothetical protein